jgi:FtsZ-binding cell division protein ZapB
MISLEQIQRLEARINQAVEVIRRLRGENESLRRSVDSAQEKVQKLEGLVGEFKTDQKEIEACIVRALQNLDRLEDDAANSPAPRRERSGARKAAEAAADTAAGPLEQPAADAETEQTPGGDGELDIF